MQRIKYDDDMLKQIADNVDLFAYVNQQIPMQRKGSDYFGHCPLHTDRTPSFSITPSKNAYYCFGCGRAGTIIGYLCDFEGMRFEDAVEKASKLAGVDMSKMCKSETIMFLKKLKACNQRQDLPYVHPIIPEADYSKYKKQNPQEWIDEGIDPSVMDLFNIRIDDMQNRIVYPVRDVKGNLINIKARTRYANYKDLRIPKYINYFPIGCMDYFQSLEITLPYIQSKKEIIVFESVKSVMKAYGWGFKNCVSAEKHTLTREQIRLLVNLHVNVVFAYDSDISYKQDDVAKDINALKRVTNVYVIEDKEKLLGGEAAKNSPADCGLDIWSTLYANKRKVV